MELIKRMIGNVIITFLVIIAVCVWLTPVVYLVNQGGGTSLILLIAYLVVTIVPAITYLTSTDSEDSED